MIRFIFGGAPFTAPGCVAPIGGIGGRPGGMCAVTGAGGRLGLICGIPGMAALCVCCMFGGIVPEIAANEPMRTGGSFFGTSKARNFKLINLQAMLNSLISILPS